MNQLEHWIQEIYSEEELEYSELGKFVKVSMKIDCYGRESDEVEMFPESQWDKVKEQGYYLG